MWSKQHRISKAGKPFGSVIEDYHASQRFMLFGDDYLKFKDYVVEGWFVFVRGSVEPPLGRPQRRRIQGAAH